MKTKILLVVSLAWLVAAMLLLCGCAGGGQEGTTVASPDTSAPTTQPGAVATETTVGATAAQVDTLGDEVARSLQRLTDANAAADALEDVSELE
jgi:hypothetical protein